METGLIYLVIGGAGSLGRRLAQELIKPEYNVMAIRVLDNNENGLAQMKVRFGESDGKVRYFLGDVRDRERLIRAAENVDVMINCAAQKHVDLGEYNPFFSIQVNVLGTQNCIDAALENNVEKFIQISSDKAVQSISTYGRCKALSESLTLDANICKGDKRTKLSVIRPPNYIDSDGSVFEIWHYQKANGLPLTLTSPQMTRYVMGFDEIVKFVIKCINMMKGGEIFIPSSGVEEVKIIDLAKKLSENIKIVGLRKGEKLHELLMDPSEEERAEMIDGIWVVR